MNKTPVIFRRTPESLLIGKQPNEADLEGTSLIPTQRSPSFSGNPEGDPYGCIAVNDLNSPSPPCCARFIRSQRRSLRLKKPGPNKEKIFFVYSRFVARPWSP